jgi:nitroreductase
MPGKNMTVFWIGMFFCLLSGNVFADSVSLGESATNPTLQTIFNRKSVRSYTGDGVSKEQLLMLVKAGMAAPSAMDRRPWDFIIITDRSVLAGLAEALPYAQAANNAPAGIIVTGDTTRQAGGKDSSSFALDCSAASENILLAAESMGLGAVWTGIYPNPERVAAVRKILAIPEHVIPLNLIPVGVPGGKDKPKDKFDPERVHENRW